MSESTIITIAELEAVTEAPDSSYIPIDNGEATNKITVGNFNASSTATATAQALKSEGYAVGEQDGVAVEDGSPYYHNNAEYYANQANNTKTTVEGYVELAQAAQTTATQKAAAAKSSAEEAYAQGVQAARAALVAHDYSIDAADSATSALTYKDSALSALTAVRVLAQDCLGYKTDAVVAANRAAAVAVKTPYIGDNGNWYVWDEAEADFVDSEEPSKGDKGDPGDPGETGEQGPAGPSGADGVSPGVTITPISGGTQVTITDATHPSGQSFNVLNGTGSGDMLSSTYDANSAVATAGGIASYVSTSISGKADVVSSPTNGDFAALNSSGNITDSGKKASDFAPAAHAADALTYGGGTATNYGHVKLSDAYQTSDGAASASVGASSKAVADSYSTLKEALTDEVETRATLGAHNLLENNGATNAFRGITYTVNSNKTISISGGTDTQASWFEFNSDDLPIGRYTFSCFDEAEYDSKVSPSGSVYMKLTAKKNGATVTTANVYGIPYTIPDSWLDGSIDNIAVSIIVNASASITGTLLAKPMIRLATDFYPKFQPYAMTNRELTDAKIDASQIAPIENGATASTSYAQGAFFIHNGKFCKAKTSISSGATFTKDTNYEETTLAAELIALAQ